jgi:hypothetical protein
MFENLLADVHDPPKFRRFTLKDENPVSGHSKKRVIAKPNPSMRTVHKRILEILDCNWFNFDPVGDSDLSPYQNAARHMHSRYFYQTDLRDAYHSVPLDGLAKVIAAGCKGWQFDETRAMLARYCFERGGKGLIVGAPASPKLFDIYAHATLDGPLAKFWPEFEFEGHAGGKPVRKVYARYRDDLTFSSPNPISEHLRQRIRGIINAAGFEVNHQKSTLLDLVKGPVIITGVGLAWNPHGKARTFLPRHYLSRMRGMLHLALKGDSRINRNEVEGLMGVFYAVFGKKASTKKHPFQLNATEAKFLRQYSQYRHRYGLQHRP